MIRNRYDLVNCVNRFNNGEHGPKNSYHFKESFIVILSLTDIYIEIDGILIPCIGSFLHTRCVYVYV